MRLLLDTHALLWWLADEERLGVRVSELIADPGNDILVSVVSFWEIVVKQRVGKLDVSVQSVLTASEDAGFIMLPISPAHLTVLATLPIHHRDPFDHLLIAQAINENAAFVTADRMASLYPVRVADW